MVTITIALVLTMMRALEPSADRMPAARNVAGAIVRVVDAEHPIFGSALRDAAVLVEMGYRESRWMPMQIGDGFRSLCEYQLQQAPIQVLWDLDLCTKLAYGRIRHSAETCLDSPLAVYAGGSCENKTAMRVSRARLVEALRLEQVVWPDDVSEQTTRRDP